MTRKGYTVLPEASSIKTRTKINLQVVQGNDREEIRFTIRAEYHYQKDLPL